MATLRLKTTLLEVIHVWRSSLPEKAVARSGAPTKGWNTLINRTQRRLKGTEGGLWTRQARHSRCAVSGGFTVPNEMRAVRVHEVGDASKLRYEHGVPVPGPGPGELLVKNMFSGLNYHDTYTRSGLYPRPLPLTLGTEGGGTVVAVGEGVSDSRIGERVAYLAEGSYAEYSVTPTHRAVRVPRVVSLRHATCLMVQGLTAHYLTKSIFPLGPGDVCLVHAAGGGTGSLVVQMAKKLGATVIALSGSIAKAESAKRHGADHSLVYRDRDGGLVPWLVEEVRRLTPNGEGVHVAYDSVGKDTALHSLACLRPRGALILYGNASGPPPDIAPLALAEQGSCFMVRPKLHDYMEDEEETAWRGAELFGHPEGPHAGEPLHVLEPVLHATMPLERAADGHRMIEARKTMGKVLFEV